MVSPASSSTKLVAPHRALPVQGTRCPYSAAAIKEKQRILIQFITLVWQNGCHCIKIEVTIPPGGNHGLESAILALEDGTVFEGRCFGAPAERSGEVVFNTALTGYQEIFTDPSYSGQIVVLTNPQIGNYGTSVKDNEAGKPYIEGLAVREFSAIASNWRSDAEANDFLARAGIPVVDDLDTRALVRHLR